MDPRIEISTDDEVMGGEPCVEGTRIPVETIVLNLKAGHTPEAILASYPTLPVGSLEAAVEWAEANGVDWRPDRPGCA